MPVRSLRVSDEVWEKAKAMCVEEGITMSELVQRLVAGLASGAIPVPTTTITYGFSQAKGEPDEG
jgi:antitoxin component of RelBE/YafQ-DinJ toxin-antitoxin module